MVKKKFITIKFDCLIPFQVPLEHIVSIEYIEDDLDETYEDRMGIGTRNSSSNITKSKHAHGTIV